MAASLESDNKSVNTIRIYLHAGRQLGDRACAQGEGIDPNTIDRFGIRDFMTQLLEHASPGNAHTNFGTVPRPGCRS